MLTRHVQRATMILGAVVAALLFFLGGAALRLAMGPISLGPFAGAIEDALNRSVSGLVVRFDQAVLEWSRTDSKVNVIVLGTRVFDLNGHIVAQAPKADLDFDAANMFVGRLSLKRFSLIGVQLTGIRSEQGVVRLGFGPEQSNSNLLETIRSMLQDSSASGGSLESFSIKDARVAFRDEKSGLFIVAPNTSFTLENKGDHLDTSLDSAIEISGVPALLSARAVLRDDGSLDHGTVDIRGLSLSALAANSFVFSGLKPYRLVSDVNASFSLGSGGELVSTTFRLTGAGSIDSPAFKPVLALNKFSVDGRYDQGPHRLVLSAVGFEGKQVSGRGKASLVLSWNGTQLDTISGDIDATRVAVNLPETLSEPLAFSGVSLRARYDLSQKRLNVQRLLVQQDPLSADVHGTISFAANGSPAAELQGSVEALPAREILKYWPTTVGTGARAWIHENISEGRVGPLSLSVGLRAGALQGERLPDEALTVTFPFQGMSARYMRGLDPLTQARGQAKLTGDTFHVSVAGGVVGPLPVSNGEVRIADLHIRGTPAHITVHTEGKMGDVLRLIDEEPLGYPKRFGIDPAAAEGQAAIDLNVAVPMLRSVTLDQVRIGVRAKATNLGMPVDRKRRLERASVDFAIDGKTLTSQGSGLLSGVPVNFKWTEDFAATRLSTRVDLTSRLDDASRALMGLSEPTWVTGPIPVSLGLTGQRFHFTDAALKADLTAASAETPTLKIVKPAGVSSIATANLHFMDGGALSMTDLAINGEGLELRGGMSFDSAGKLLDVSLSNVRAGANHDFAMDLRPLPTGGLFVHIEGKSLDATQFFGGGKNNKETKAPPLPLEKEVQEPLSLTTKLDRVVVRENVDIHGVSFAVAYGAQQRLTGFNLDASGPGKGKVTGRFRLDGATRHLTLEADDAGAFVDAFTDFSSMRDGHLAVNVSFPADGVQGSAAPKTPIDYQGTIALSNIVLTDQPFITRLFAAGSLDGPLRLLQGDGIALAKVDAQFSVRGKMVTIREGRVSGSAIGASFAGMLDRSTDHVDLAGTLVPVYGLNSVLGAVPILGDILVSKKGEGIFGLTYAMKGNLGEPVLAVNPLSVLTPGIFRRIFEFSTPKDPQTEAAATPTPEAVPAAPPR